MNTQPFVFDLNFDLSEEALNAAKNPEVLPLLYNEDDIQAAYKKGYTEGRNYGFEEGFVQGELRAITERQLAIQAAFVKIYELLESILKKEEIFEEYIQNAVLQLTQTILQKVFPYFCEQHSSDELIHAINTILQTLLEPEPIHIFLSPLSLHDVQEKIEGIQKRYQGHVLLAPLETLDPWECKIDWKGGGAKWSQDLLLKKILTYFSTQSTEDILKNKQINTVIEE